MGGTVDVISGNYLGGGEGRQGERGSAYMCACACGGE